MKTQTVFWFLITVILILSLLGGCEKAPSQSPDKPNPEQVTTAKKIELSGCGNLYRVTDVLYRGEQPTAEGFKELEKLGIKTVINLRSLHSDRDELQGTQLDYEHIRMKAWNPEQDEIEAFLTIVTNPEKQPVFVHCQHGADRTGTMVAVYRIIVEGWTIEKAVDEMRNGPFGFHDIWTGLPTFIKELDIQTLRKTYAIE